MAIDTDDLKLKQNSWGFATNLTGIDRQLNAT